MNQAPKRYLADTSALVHLRFPAIAERLFPLVNQGLVARYGIVDLEMLFTARSHAHLVTLRREQLRGFPLIPMHQADAERAIETMIGLAAAGKHRSAKVADLLIAAAAERAGVVLLHYDSDFDHIAAVTGQATEWIAPRGSLGP